MVGARRRSATERAKVAAAPIVATRIASASSAVAAVRAVWIAWVTRASASAGPSSGSGPPSTRFRLLLAASAVVRAATVLTLFPLLRELLSDDPAGA